MIYSDLKVWQKAMGLVDKTYFVASKFPKEEVFGLRSQITRAAVSIPSNIAEGSRRGSRKDYRRFLYMAYGSGAEMETPLLIVERRKWVHNESLAEVSELLTEIMKMLNSLIRSLS